MTIFQGYDGELRLYDYGTGGTSHYLEVLFCEMDFSGPVSRGRNEERLVMDRGKFDSNAHYVQGTDDDIYAAMPFSFSCRLADTVNTRVLADWIGGVTSITNAGGGATTLYSWGGLTDIKARDGSAVSVPNFTDAVKMRYRVECLWDGTNDYGTRYEEVYFNPNNQTITESPDGLMLNCNGQIYGDVTRITAFSSGYTAFV